MLGLIVVLLTTLALHHWLLEPFAHLSTPLFSLSWLGWALVGVAAWLFAGARRSP